MDSYFGVLTGRGACGLVRKGALLWLVTVRYLTLKLVSVQKNNLFLCAPLADHFASLYKLRYTCLCYAQNCIGSSEGYWAQ